MIQDYNFFYNILRLYSNTFYPLAYSQIECVGNENIPKDGAVIFAPNHSNAFMDALAVYYVAKSPVVFVARADIFRNPIAAKIFRFFKIMPIMRIRDGRENLKKDYAIMRSAVDVLRAGVPFGIFSEGTHRMKHSILPLVKGIFRIALQADEGLKDEMPVYIVPVGIDYGSYTHFRSTLSLNIGKPLNVSDFVNDNVGKTQPEIIRDLRIILSKKISELYHCIPDDNKDYEAILDVSYIRNHNVLKSRSQKKSPYQVMLANRQTVDDLNNLSVNDPDKYNALMSLAREFAMQRRAKGIDDESLYMSVSHKKNFSRILGLIFTLPYMIFCSIVNLPVSIVTGLIFISIEDDAMKNSLRYAILLILYPFVLLTVAVLLALYFPWYVMVVGVVIAFPANIFVHKYAKVIRLIRSDLRLMKSDVLCSLKSKILNFKF